MSDLVGKRGRMALAESRQCTATNRNGERCGRASIPGGFVCNLHGGNAPQTLKAAQQRLLSLIEPALDVLHSILRIAPACAVCGRRDDLSAVVAAAKAVIDRVLPKLLDVQVSRAPEPALWVDYMPEEQLQQVVTWIEEAEGRMRRGERPVYRPTPPVIDVPSSDGDDSVLL
jgi:hypothetical protein